MLFTTSRFAGARIGLTLAESHAEQFQNERVKAQWTTAGSNRRRGKIANLRYSATFGKRATPSRPAALPRRRARRSKGAHGISAHTHGMQFLYACAQERHPDLLETGCGRCSSPRPDVDCHTLVVQVRHGLGLSLEDAVCGAVAIGGSRASLDGGRPWHPAALTGNSYRTHGEPPRVV